MKHYLCSELSHLSMRHKLRGLTLLEDALDYDDLPENSEAALLAALTPLITREKFLLRKRAIEALTALARRRPGGRLHCPAPALVAAWQALQDCATDPEVLLRDRSAASAAALLGALSPKSQAEPLRRLLAALGADSWRVREQALLTLARGAAAQPPLAVPLARAAEVARLLQHERAEVAEAAALLLQQMHSGHGDELTKLLASLHAEVPQLAGVLTVRDTAPPAAERRPLHESKPRAKSREEIVLAIPRELARSPKAVPRRAMPNGGSAEAPGSSRSQPPGSPVSLRRELAASSKMRRLTEAAEELEAPVPSAVPAGAALASEMDDLRTTLLNTKGAWEARAAALRRVWALMLGGMSLRDDFGTAQLKSLVEPLVACLSDLRSSLVRDACCVMRLLALLHGDALEPLLDAHEKGWVATLLRLTSTTQTAVIGEAGHAAMRTIIRCCRLGKALPLLVNGCFDKNGTKALQGRCAEYVLLVLEEASTATLERVASQLRACLIKLASHPLAEARQSGRACFWAFSRHFPDTMRGLVEQLEAPVLKAVVAARPSLLAVPASAYERMPRPPTRRPWALAPDGDATAGDGDRANLAVGSEVPAAARTEVKVMPRGKGTRSAATSATEDVAAIGGGAATPEPSPPTAGGGSKLVRRRKPDGNVVKAKSLPPRPFEGESIGVRAVGDNAARSTSDQSARSDTSSSAAAASASSDRERELRRPGSAVVSRPDQRSAGAASRAASTPPLRREGHAAGGGAAISARKLAAKPPRPRQNPEDANHGRLRAHSAQSTIAAAGEVSTAWADPGSGGGSGGGMSRVEPPPHTALAMADGVMPPHNRLARIVSGEQLPVGVSSILVGDPLEQARTEAMEEAMAMAEAVVMARVEEARAASRAEGREEARAELTAATRDQMMAAARVEAMAEVGAQARSAMRSESEIREGLRAELQREIEGEHRARSRPAAAATRVAVAGQLDALLDACRTRVSALESRNRELHAALAHLNGEIYGSV